MPCLNSVCIGKYMNQCMGVQPVQNIGPIFKYSTSLNIFSKDTVDLLMRIEQIFSWISFLMFSEMQFLIIFLFY